MMLSAPSSIIAIIFATTAAAATLGPAIGSTTARVGKGLFLRNITMVISTAVVPTPADTAAVRGGLVVVALVIGGVGIHGGWPILSDGEWW